jgi:hypothetical protein
MINSGQSGLMLNTIMVKHRQTLHPTNGPSTILKKSTQFWVHYISNISTVVFQASWNHTHMAGKLWGPQKQSVTGTSDISTTPFMRTWNKALKATYTKSRNYWHWNSSESDDCTTSFLFTKSSFVLSTKTILSILFINLMNWGPNILVSIWAVEIAVKLQL